ncbi:hypothetical protein PflSS101_1174 [Pseudomonas lactis]|uniref:Uncharacterized protein n=1 Tax=Pseudomonas lactis TaxID=1615674 RepID=I4K433_9PSED|nr:hypothetical protein PflSS101_1174 [Pseudomonas lactis]
MRSDEPPPANAAGLFSPGENRNATEKDRGILARTLRGESRGEGIEGKIAVAWIIRNRVFDGKAKLWWGRLRRCMPEALAVQLLEPERPELHLPEW